MADQQPPGIGTPGGHHPGFSQPAPGWAPPQPGSRVPAAVPGPAWAPPPTGRRPRRGPGRRSIVALAVVTALLLVGILSALPLAPAPGPAPTPTPQPTSAPTEIVTASPAPAPTAAVTLTAGGDIGRAVPFSGDLGDGTLTVTSATWSDVGEAPPPQGRRHLVLDVTVTAERGEVAVEPILLLLGVGEDEVLPGFGPALAEPLGGRLLTAGEQVRGQVGYTVAPGPVRLHLLDDRLRRLATVEVAGP